MRWAASPMQAPLQRTRNQRDPRCVEGMKLSSHCPLAATADQNSTGQRMPGGLKPGCHAEPDRKASSEAGTIAGTIVALTVQFFRCSSTAVELEFEGRRHTVGKLSTPSCRLRQAARALSMPWKTPSKFVAYFSLGTFTGTIVY